MESEINKFLYEWVNNNDYCEIHLQEKIDRQKLDPQKWLKAFAVESKKNIKHLDWEYLSKQRRGLKKLLKIAKNVQIEAGYMLASVFLNIATVRDNIKEMDDFSCNPYDFDYDISPDDISKTLNEVREYMFDKKPKRMICAVVTKDASQPIACPKCEGKGFLNVKNVRAADENSTWTATLLTGKKG